jgi:hypothetical protein
MKKLLVGILVLTSLMTCWGVYHKTHNKKALPPPFSKIEIRPDKGPEIVRPPDPVPPSPQLLTMEQARDLITEAKTKEIVYWLADEAREGRMSGKKGNKDAAAYIKQRFETAGLKASYQQFSIRRLNAGPKNEDGDNFTNNIIGVLPGETDNTIYICSHIDHVGWGPSMTLDNKVGIHPGADDNASGCAGVISCAESFAKIKKLRHTLVFITFSGEEMGLLGSRHYVQQLKKEDTSKIDLMVNFDMIGRLAPKKTCQAIGARKSPDLMALIQKLEAKSPVKFEPSMGDNDNGSDHAPFRNVGVPFCFFFTGMHQQYHRVTDKADTIDYAGLTNISRFVFEMVYEYDKQVLGRQKK